MDAPPSGARPGPVRVRVRIGAELPADWADWLGGMTPERVGGGETVLVGAVRDQAALFGLLLTIRDFNLPLLSLERLDGPTGPEPLSTLQ